MEVINGAPYTPENLISNVFLGSGVEIVDIQYLGDNLSVGYFQGGQEAIGMNRGIVLTTGSTVDNGGGVVGIANFGQDNASTNVLNGVTDVDLQTIAGPTNSVNDAATYIIRFQPASDTIRFRYVFASEEYPDYVCSDFNDIFGFFISGPGINGPFSNNAENIALIPGTNLPVQINNLNSGTPGGSYSAAGCTPPFGSLAYSQFFVDNDETQKQPVFNGYTTVLTAEAVVVPCETYTIKLTIADVSDSVLDSGVFLEAESFGSGETTLEVVDLALNGTMAEGCRPAQLRFSIDAPTLLPFMLDYEVFGTAENGVDFTLIPDGLFIPAGDTSLVLDLELFEDNVPEGTERLLIGFQRTYCTRDTIEILLTDNPLEPSLLPDEVDICPGDTIQLDGTIPIPAPEPLEFRSTVEMPILGVNQPNISTIEVSNVSPFLEDGIIKQVCIDSLTHQWISDVDAYLISPNGDILELTTDNGADGGNLFGPDGYYGTCFSPTAETRIAPVGGNAPASAVPFTGTFQPEGDWNNLYRPGASTNGTWQLVVIDDQFGFTGTLFEWSICFNPAYSIDYAWEPAPELSCLDCPAPQVSATGNGLYRMTATDTYGCVQSDSVQVNLVETPPMSQPVCGETSDTTLQIRWPAVDGAEGYEVRVLPRGWVTLPAGELEYTFFELTPETEYVFEVRAMFPACPSPPQTVSCATLPCLPPELTPQVLDISCFGANDGSITLAAEGFHAPISLTLNNLPGLDDETYPNLSAGSYSAQAVNGIGCETEMIIEITEPAPIEGSSLLVAPVSCFGQEDAAVTLEVAGGTGPFAFAWSENGAAVSTDSIAGDLGSGQYAVLVTDSRDCEASFVIDVDEPAALESTFTTTLQNCAGPPNGTLSLSPSGGTQPYTYDYDFNTNGQNGSSLQGLLAGTYDLSIIDGRGCRIDTTVTIGREPDVTLSAISNDLLCHGASDGFIDTEVTFGQPPYTFAWSNGALPATPDQQNLTSGTYNLTITDGRGCRADTTILIKEPPPFAINEQITDATCTGSATGTIATGLVGGTPPYAYSWQDGATTAGRQNLIAGAYTLTIRDANDCEETFRFDIEERPPLAVNFTVDPADCFGASTGAIYPTVVNSDGALNFSWNGQSGSRNLENIPAGTYELEITDRFGCTSTEQVTVSEPPPVLSNVDFQNIRCHGEDNGLIQLFPSGGTPGYEFRIGNREFGGSSFRFELSPGRYEVQVRDANGCLSDVAEVGILEPSPFEIELGENQSIFYGDSLRLQPIISGGTEPILRWEWSPADSTLISCADCPDPWVRSNGQISLRLRATDSEGCIAEDMITIFVEKDFPIAIPTGFTPNGDGFNDRLMVHGRPGIEIMSFRVFDRWGEMLYEDGGFMTNDNDRGWDGRFRDQWVNGGVFLWQVEVKYPDAMTEVFSGQTTLIR